MARGQVSQQRTRLAFARCSTALVDVHHPAAERIVLVLDQLNPHSPTSLDAAVPPNEAKRLSDKREIHDTPKHGGLLNMVETELAVLQRQCLSQRFDGQAALARRDGVGGATQCGDCRDRLALHHG